MQKSMSAFIAVLFLSFSVRAQQPTVEINLSDSVPCEPNLVIGRLENGLTYYIKENKKPEDRAELRLVVKAGSILENEDQLGLAHFVEHMAFNGTKNFEKNELISYLQSIGVKFGADLNAYTSFDETVYILPVPTDDKKILDQSFKILEDWAHNLSFDEEEIDRERGVVIEEWRRGRGASQRMRDKTFPVLLKDSKYAARLPIGTLENLENFEHESLKQFYKDWYRPDLMAVIAVGDFDTEEIELKIKAHFAHLKNPENKKERKAYIIPDQKETRVTIATDPEAPFSSVSLIIFNESEQQALLNDYYTGLLHFFYTGMLNQRLGEMAEKPKAPFLGAGTNYSRFLGDKYAFTAGASTKDGGQLTGFEALMSEIERVKRYGFTEPELERYKMNILNYFEKAYNERDKSPSSKYAAEYIRNFLYNEPVPGIAFENAFVQKHIPEITLDEVNTLSEKFFRPDNRVVVVNAPENEVIGLPTEEELLNAVNQAVEKHVSPYIDEISGAELISVLPKPGTVVSEKKSEKINVTELVLSNGAKVILKPTDFKNDEMLMTAWSDGGTSLYSDEDYQSAANADAIVNECGIADFSPTDLQKLLSGKTVSVRPYIGALTEGMNGSCTPKDMKTMFQLIYLYFTNPNKSRDLFEAYIEKSKALYKNLLANPNYYFYNESAKILSRNSLRGGQFPTEEDWDKIDFDRAFEIYAERFANAADFRFILVGNFNIDSVKQYLAQYIGSLPSSTDRETWKDLGIRPPSGVVKKDIFKGTDPKSSVTMRFHGKYEFDRKTNQLFTTLTDVTDILLDEKIREEKSGVYTISAKASTNKDPYENYTVSITFPCKPENSDTLTNAVLEIIEQIKTKGIPEATLQKVKETQTRQMQVKIKENGYWLGALKYSIEYGYDPNEIPNYQKRIDAVTEEQLRQTAEKYLNIDSYIYLRLLPENKEQ